MEDVFIKAENGTVVSFDMWDEKAIWMYISFKSGTVSFTMPKDQAKLMIKVLQEILDNESADQSI